MTLWVGALLGCALVRPIRYEAVDFSLGPASPSFVRDLPARIEADLAAGRIRALVRGDDPTTPLSPTDMTDEALYGLYGFLRPWARGAELDLLVDVGAGPKPVSVWFDRGRVAAVAWSDAEVRRAEPSHGTSLQAWKDSLAEQNGLAGFEDGDVAWTLREVGDVATALARMSDQERSLLEGVVLVRLSESSTAPRTEEALFVSSVEPPRIEFFDLAFDSDGTAFVGRVDAPWPAGAMTALHEFAHVIADAPTRRAYQAFLGAPDGEDDERYDVYRTLGRDNPVLAEWKAFRARRPGPSQYGLRSVSESFAESFALYHLDPDALDRALPGATEWFSDGTHLVAALPTDPD